MRNEGYDIVSLDEARRRLLDPGPCKPFVSFTLDDGYSDNLRQAYPVFAGHRVPFCVYVATSFAEGRGDLWWQNLEAALSAGRPLTVTRDGAARQFECGSPAQQKQAWRQLYWWLRGIDEDRARAIVRDLCAQAGIDQSRSSRDFMTVNEVKTLADDPLCTIGAHTVNHYSLAKLDDARCFDEIAAGKRRLEEMLGCPVRHFSYPYGSAIDCGKREFAMAAKAEFETAVTTRKGLLFPSHRERLMQLPRLSLNGDFQDLNMLAVLLSGAPFALLNGIRQMAPA